MMISDFKRLEHEIFVSGYNGSSPVDIIFAVSSIIPGAALATSFTCNLGLLMCFMIEYLLCSLPLILSFTYLNEYTLELNTVMLLLLFIRLTYVSKTNNGNSSNLLVQRNQLSFLTACRASVNLATIIAILAVDFHIFPRRFAKTEISGYSLMDVGAACYVFMNAVTDNKYKLIKRNIVMDTICLSLLGIIRLLAVSATHYQHHVTEYGLHANFFFTLAFIKISCFWIPLIPLPLKVILGFLLSLAHQANLNSGLGLWTLSDEPRDNLIAANREWFVSMPGFIAIYLFGSACGEYIFFRKPTVYKLGALSLIPFCILVISEVFFLIYPSRRLANLPFVLWITAFFNFILTFFKAIEDQLLRKSLTCLLFAAINTYPLSFFLLGNMFTGLINIYCNTLEKSNIFAFLIINIYVFTLLSVVTVLYSRKVKLKMCN